MDPPARDAGAGPGRLAALSSAHDAEESVRLSTEFHAWLEQQPGFVSYELVGSGRHWADAIEWRDLACATAGNDAFATTSLRSAFARVVETYTAVSGPTIDTRPDAGP